VVLERNTWEHWIEPDLSDRDELELLLRPTTNGTLVQCRVSRDVGPIRNDRPALVEEGSVGHQVSSIRHRNAPVTRISEP